jgi:hypothetical protein
VYVCGTVLVCVTALFPRMIPCSHAAVRLTLIRFVFSASAARADKKKPADDSGVAQDTESKEDFKGSSSKRARSPSDDDAENERKSIRARKGVTVTVCLSCVVPSMVSRHFAQLTLSSELSVFRVRVWVCSCVGLSRLRSVACGMFLTPVNSQSLVLFGSQLLCVGLINPNRFRTVASLVGLKVSFFGCLLTLLIWVPLNSLVCGCVRESLALSVSTCCVLLWNASIVYVCGAVLVCLAVSFTQIHDPLSLSGCTAHFDSVWFSSRGRQEEAGRRFWRGSGHREQGRLQGLLQQACSIAQ